MTGLPVRFPEEEPRFVEATQEQWLDEVLSAADDAAVHPRTN